jgi:hypothetical protein
MPSCEVQRTLVKSPPELWAELSDPASLAKHLGDFGEIRTTRVEPETAVEWEADDVRGVVQLKPSGWGTKVTMTAIRELPVEENVADIEAEPEPAVEPVLEAEPELEPEPEPVVEADPEAEPAAEPEILRGPRSSLFARIFRRWRKAQPETEAAPEPAGEAELTLEAAPALKSESEAEPESEAASEPAVEPEPSPEPAPLAEGRPDLAAELAQVEAEMQAQDAALLSAVLDRLGAAHHRPFSRG